MDLYRDILALRIYWILQRGVRTLIRGEGVIHLDYRK